MPHYDLDGSGPRRAVAGGAVVLLHGLLLMGIMLAPPPRSRVIPQVAAMLILQTPKRPPPLPLLPAPALAAPPPMFAPVPEIKLATPEAPPPSAAPRAVTRTAPPASHFGAASDSDLGLDVATAAGGGAGSRGTLAGFEAAVRRQVLAGKRQPSLAWDRRNTCVVDYRVTVSRAGRVAGFSIEPCAIPEINEAARTAIAQAGPFPPPPNLGAATYDVHGTLIFHP